MITIGQQRPADEHSGEIRVSLKVMTSNRHLSDNVEYDTYCLHLIPLICVDNMRQ